MWVERGGGCSAERLPWVLHLQLKPELAMDLLVVRISRANGMPIAAAVAPRMTPTGKTGWLGLRGQCSPMCVLLSAVTQKVEPRSSPSMKSEIAPRLNAGDQDR